MANGASPNRSELGRLIEDRALDMLTAAGLLLLQRNFRCPLGEIDLIMREGRTIVFVEVRHRSSKAFGGAAASVGASKQRRLRRAAEWYLGRHLSARQLPCRFDVISSDGKLDGAHSLHWHKAAF